MNIQHSKIIGEFTVIYLHDRAARFFGGFMEDLN